MTARVLAAVLVVLLTVPLAAHDWTGVAEKLEAASFRLRSTTPAGYTGSCVAWLVNDADDYVVTAGHCVQDMTSITVRDRHASVEKLNTTLDLAVLKVKGLRGSPLVFRPTPLVKGVAAAVLGYPLELGSPVFRAGWVAHPNAEHPRTGEAAVLLDLVVQAGHSGSAVVDRNGFVFSLVLSTMPDPGSRWITLGVQRKPLLDFVEDYLPSRTQ